MISGPNNNSNDNQVHKESNELPWEMSDFNVASYKIAAIDFEFPLVISDISQKLALTPQCI